MLPPAPVLVSRNRQEMQMFCVSGTQGCGLMNPLSYFRTIHFVHFAVRKHLQWFISFKLFGLQYLVKPSLPSKIVIHP